MNHLKRSLPSKNNKKVNKQFSMSIGLTFLGSFLMWLMWISVYMHQMNPLINPIAEPKEA